MCVFSAVGQANQIALSRISKDSTVTSLACILCEGQP